MSYKSLFGFPQERICFYLFMYDIVRTSLIQNATSNTMGSSQLRLFLIIIRSNRITTDKRKKCNTFQVKKGRNKRMGGQHFSHLQSTDCDIDVFQVLQCRKKNSLWLHEKKKRETETEIKQSLILTMATIGFRKRQQLRRNRFRNLCNVKAKSSYLILVFNYLSNLFNLLP